jgi:hypothetical protein
VDVRAEVRTVARQGKAQPGEFLTQGDEGSGAAQAALPQAPAGSPAACPSVPPPRFARLSRMLVTSESRPDARDADDDRRQTYALRAVLKHP